MLLSCSGSRRAQEAEECFASLIPITSKEFVSMVNESPLYLVWWRVDEVDQMMSPYLCYEHSFYIKYNLVILIDIMIQLITIWKHLNSIASLFDSTY